MLDIIDERIVNEIAGNAKIPLRTLAKKLKVSYVTVMNRIKKLEQDGIISSYRTQIDFERIGFDIHAMITVRIQKGKLFEFEKKVASHPNVYAVYDVTGNFDCVILARFRTTKTMDSFLKKIQRYEFVERTNTQMILNTIKDEQIKL
jgi:DNA-binding Lrp family transcriptional regulator